MKDFQIYLYFNDTLKQVYVYNADSITKAISIVKKRYGDEVRVIRVEQIFLTYATYKDWLIGEIIIAQQKKIYTREDLMNLSIRTLERTFENVG